MRLKFLALLCCTAVIGSACSGDEGVEISLPEPEDAVTLSDACYYKVVFSGEDTLDHELISEAFALEWDSQATARKDAIAAFISNDTETNALYVKASEPCDGSRRIVTSIINDVVEDLSARLRRKVGVTDIQMSTEDEMLRRQL